MSDRVAEVGADVAITIVTVQELFNGWVVSTIVTRNYRDFSQVPGLLLEDWTQGN